jgi:hypothetical protein
VTAHAGGLPLEEALVQIAPAAAATATVVALAARATYGRLLTRWRRARPSSDGEEA